MQYLLLTVCATLMQYATLAVDCGHGKTCKIVETFQHECIFYRGCQWPCAVGSSSLLNLRIKDVMILFVFSDDTCIVTHHADYPLCPTAFCTTNYANTIVAVIGTVVFAAALLVGAWWIRRTGRQRNRTLRQVSARNAENMLELQPIYRSTTVTEQ